MKPLKIRLYPERSLYYLVLIWPDMKTMQARVEKLVGAKRNFGGCTVTYSTKERIIGEIHLCRPQLGIGLVTHEIGHAAFGWARRVDLKVDSQGEERMCRVLQKMVNRFVSRARKLGLYG